MGRRRRGATAVGILSTTITPNLEVQLKSEPLSSQLGLLVVSKDHRGIITIRREDARQVDQTHLQTGTTVWLDEPQGQPLRLQTRQATTTQKRGEAVAQRESKRSRDILKALRGQGAFCFKVWGSEHMMAGLPDIIGCYRGRFFGFEVKHPETRENTSARQEYVMSKIAQAGGVAKVVCTKEEAVDQLSFIDADDEAGT